MAIADRLDKVLAGKYRLKAFIGAGGMGVVYAASHRMTEERVAVKFLRRELLEDEESTRRFIQEARAVAQLRHPNTLIQEPSARGKQTLFRPTWIPKNQAWQLRDWVMTYVSKVGAQTSGT